MPSVDPKDAFAAFDDEGDGLIDAAEIGSVCRALDLKISNKMVDEAAGKKYEKGDKRIKFDEFQPIYEKLKSQKPLGNYNDFVEGVKVYDYDGKGKVGLLELNHLLMALGERLTKDQVDEITDGAADDEDNVDYEKFIKKVVAGPFPDQDA